MAYPNEQSAPAGPDGPVPPAGGGPLSGSPSGDQPAGGLPAGEPSAGGASAGGPFPVGPFPAGPFFGGGQEWQQWFRLRQGSRRPWRRSLAVAAGSAVGIVLLGVPFGLLWAWLAPAVPVIDAGQAGVLVTDPSPEQYIAADGWFTLLGLGFGLIVTIAAWLLLRRDRGPFLLLGVVGGTLLAGRWVAPMAGEFLGRDAYDQWRATAAQGATYLAPPEVQALGPKLVPAFVAAIVLTLLAGWSNDPDLDHPGAMPGYGANHPGTFPGYGAGHPDPHLPGASYGADHPDLPGGLPGHGANQSSMPAAEEPSGSPATISDQQRRYGRPSSFDAGPDPSGRLDGGAAEGPRQHEPRHPD